jgi:hypothetical protein
MEAAGIEPAFSESSRGLTGGTGSHKRDEPGDSSSDDPHKPSQSYPKSIYAGRRHEAANLGYSANVSGRSNGCVLASLLASYVRAVDTN